MDRSASISSPQIEIKTNEMIMEYKANLNVSYQGNVMGKGRGGRHTGASFGGSGGRTDHDDLNSSDNVTIGDVQVIVNDENKTPFFWNCMQENCIGHYDISRYITYDNEGSGGGTKNTKSGGSIRIYASKSLSMLKESKLEANGMPGIDSGAGSGGIIYVETNALSLHGKIEARGGNAICDKVCFPAGGGGRSMIVFASSDIIKQQVIVVDGVVLVSELSQQDIVVDGGISANDSRTLGGSAGTDFRIAVSTSTNTNTSHLWVRNRNISRTIGNSATPLKVQSTLTSLHIEGSNVVSTGSLMLEKGLIVKNNSNLVAMVTNFSVHANNIHIVEQSKVHSLGGLEFIGNAFQLGWNSSIIFKTFITVEGSERIEVAGSIVSSAINLDPPQARLHGGTITVGGRISADRIQIASTDLLAITGSVSATLPQCEQRIWSSCQTLPDYPYIDTNYSMVVTSNKSMYIGQEADFALLQASTLLVCARNLLVIAAGSSMNTSSRACGAEQGIGHGVCELVNGKNIGTGAGHGGRGAVLEKGIPSTFGRTYGSEEGDGLVGSGGGCDGGAGGGLAHVGSSFVVLNGTITANGGDGVGNGGGGSGGTVVIYANNQLVGSGNASADGGNSLQGAGGGGGRLQLHVCDSAMPFRSMCSSEYHGNMTATGGSGSNALLSGQNGTRVGGDCPLGTTGLFCHKCPAGTYKTEVGPQECKPCSNAPKNAFYSMEGSISSHCDWICSPGYSGSHCRDPLRELEHELGGFWGFTSIILGIVGILIVIGWTYRRQSNHRRHERYLKRSNSTKNERQQLLRSMTAEKSILGWPWSCCKLPRVAYPKLQEKDLAAHLYRIYLSGDNTVGRPWRLESQVPVELTSVVFEEDYERFSKRVNMAMEWPAPGVWHSGANFLEYLVALFCYPLGRELLKYRQYRRLNALKRLVSRDSHSFLRGTRARALLNAVKMGYSADYSLAYIEILHREGEVANPNVYVGKPRLPMVLLLSGRGTYLQPYALDPQDLLVRSVPQCAELTTFIDEAWIEMVAELNAACRCIHSRAIESTLKPVLQLLEEKNASLALGGLQLHLGKFWTSVEAYDSDSFKLGLLLMGSEASTPVAMPFIVTRQGSDGRTSDVELEMVSDHPQVTRGIREEALRMRKSFSGSEGPMLGPNIGQPSSPRTSFHLNSKTLSFLDSTLPLPGIVWTLSDLKSWHILCPLASRQRYMWAIYSRIFPRNVRTWTWLPSSWAVWILLLVLLLVDFVSSFLILLNLQCITDGNLDIACTYVDQSSLKPNSYRFILGLLI